METQQLEKAIKHDSCLSTLGHSGVLAADELSLIKRPGAYIVNTDPSHMPGQHWIAIYVPDQGPLEIFDPLGFHPNHYTFLKMYLKGKKIKYNVKRWQQAGTSTCGQFCIFYLYHKCRGWTLSHILDYYWNSDLNQNERLVVRFVGHYFCIPCSCRPTKYQCALPCM